MIQWILLALFGSGLNYSDSGHTAIEDALWQGELEIRVTGPMHTQALSNRTAGDDSNTAAMEFLKEKGAMKIDFTLNFKFQINALGEFSMVETEVMTGGQSLTVERRYQFVEEKFIEKTRISAQQRVKVSERRSMKATFNHKARHDESDFEAGVFKLIPSGRMNKKGSIQVVGDLNFRFAADGETDILEERQPPSETWGQRKVTEKITRFYDLPMTFDFKISHRRKAVDGSFPVKITITNPFAAEEETDGRRDVFRHTIKAHGTYKLIPLF